MSSCTSQGINDTDCDKCKQFISMDCTLALYPERYSADVYQRLVSSCASHDPALPSDMVLEFFDESTEEACCSMFLHQISKAPVPPDAGQCPLQSYSGALKTQRISWRGDANQPRASCDGPDAQSQAQNDGSTITIGGLGACMPLGMEMQVNEWPAGCDTFPLNYCMETTFPNQATAQAAQPLNVSDIFRQFTV